MLEVMVKGGKISISESGVLKRSSDEETIKTFKVFEEYLVKVLSKEGNKIIVDWQEMEKVIRLADHRERQAIRQYIYSVLLSLDLLTEDPKESYSFSEPELNPVWGISGSDYSTLRIGILYFKRKEDIVAYGKARWSKSLLDKWAIFKMTELMEKQEICK